MPLVFDICVLLVGFALVLNAFPFSKVCKSACLIAMLNFVFAQEGIRLNIISGNFEGDIILPRNSHRGVGDRLETQRWPDGIVPYVIDESIDVDHVDLIIDAMRKMENLTAVNDVSCIRFRPKEDTDEYHIKIENGTGCSAVLGYDLGFEGDRIVTLMHTNTSTCMKTGIIQHELLHVLGFYHEQSRPDRDEYIDVHWDNIIESKKFNFDKYGHDNVDTLNTSYDYGSVLHYGATAFSINGTPTITPKLDADAIIGQRDGMSLIDILEVQRYYKCLPIASFLTTSTQPLPSTATSSAIDIRSLFATDGQTYIFVLTWIICFYEKQFNYHHN